jgi:hypothetical protein
MTWDIERRDSVRHETLDDRTSIQVIMEGAGDQIRVRPARLINISSTGALIHTEQVPRFYQLLRFRLENAPEIGWVAADPVRYGQANEVGIRFARPFPPDFLSKSLSERNSAVTFLSEDESRSLIEDIVANWRLDIPEEN